MKVKFIVLSVFINLIHKDCFTQTSPCKCDTISIFLSYPYDHDSRFRLNERESHSMICTKDFYYITYFTCMGDSYLEEYTKDSILIAKGNLKPIYSKTEFNVLETHTDKYGNIKDTIPKVYVYSLEKTGIWYYYDRTGKLTSTINHVAKKLSQKALKKRSKIYLDKIEKLRPDYCKKYPIECGW